MEKLNCFLDKKRNLYGLAIAAILLESLTVPFLKLGGRYPFLSPMYLICFAAAVMIMGAYAVAWQLILERIPLTTAYLRKGVSYILVFVWGSLLFHEAIKPKQIIGVIVIIIGMVVSMSDES